MTSTFVCEETDQTTYVGTSLRATTAEPNPRPPIETRAKIQALCPFCGEVNLDDAAPCGHCNQLDTSATRAAATQRSGLWFVHANHATSNGIGFSELLTLIHQHIVSPASIVRGPATGQLYRPAGTVRGLGREFGQCFSCGGDVDSTETICPHCDRVQTVQEFAGQNPAPTPTQGSAGSATAGSSNETPGSSEYLRDRRQVLEHAVAEAEPLIPEVAGPAREALLGEPTIRVHSLADHEPVADEDADFFVRPVIAERTERHIPKDDLLTPSELAKAFQLEFSMKADDMDPDYRPYRIPGKTTRQIKIVLAGTGALAIAFVLGMQAIRLFAPPPARSHGPRVAITSPAVAPVPPIQAIKPAPEAQLASDRAFAAPTPVIKPIEKPAVSVVIATPVVMPAPAPIVTPLPVPKPDLVVIPAPVPAPVKPTVVVVVPVPQPAPRPVQNPTVSQAMYIEPAPVQSNEDDPKILLNTGLTAESNGNYAAAIHAYERIQSLPSAQWPANLLTRLQLAKKELKGDLN